jgi:hypothetical protein
MVGFANNKEMRSRVVEMALAVYRVTDFFPQSEALRNSLREKANEIVEGIVERGFESDFSRDTALLIQKVQTLLQYLALARNMRFMRSVNFTVLEREYRAVQEALQRELDVLDTVHQAGEGGRSASHSDVQSSERKKKIAEEPVLNPEGVLQANRAHKRKEATAKDAQARIHVKDRDENTDIARNTDSQGMPVRESANGMSMRQKIILNHVHKMKRAKISDFFTLFDGISSKTIQRDLQYLVDRRVLKKEGEKRWTIYSLKP